MSSSWPEPLHISMGWVFATGKFEVRAFVDLSWHAIQYSDIKPHNLLVDPHSMTLKLCDFGSAKLFVPGEPNVAYICSRFYRAPELIFGSTDYTFSIDVWSMGCVFAELLIGSPLFPGNSGVDQLVEIIKVRRRPLPKLLSWCLCTSRFWEHRQKRNYEWWIQAIKNSNSRRYGHFPGAASFVPLLPPIWLIVSARCCVLLQRPVSRRLKHVLTRAFLSWELHDHGILRIHLLHCLQSCFSLHLKSYLWPVPKFEIFFLRTMPPGEFGPGSHNTTKNMMLLWHIWFIFTSFFFRHYDRPALDRVL